MKHISDTNPAKSGNTTLSSSQRLLLALDEAVTKLEVYEQRQSEPIAVVGLGCRFPGADSPAAFWGLLRDGVDAIGEVPKARWDVDAYYDPDPDAPGKMYVRQGGFIEQQVDLFDAPFFGISHREAVGMDPQQRLLLEVSWEALEDAGQAPDRLKRSQTGVFIGINTDDYADFTLSNPDKIDAYSVLGDEHSIAVGRIAYILGLQGPVIQLDTACSSSLVALHLAVQSLRARECNMALAGGVNLILSPLSMVHRSKVKALSPDGRCKTFDAKADGYGVGEGCGMLVLKRLSDARENGDNILALIRGSAINHDGPSSGLTVPNQRAQEKLIRQALKNAQIKPDQISYVEAHGTGTSLGDPIEVGALGAVFGKGRQEPLIIGSVKSNFGHLEAAAGIACLIKVILALKHQEIPPHLHFHEPNPHIPWDHLPITVATERLPWDAPERYAGVSSFGLNGTNVHVVLEAQQAASPPDLGIEGASGRQDKEKEQRTLHLLALSAKTEEALLELQQRYAEYLTHTDASIEHICFTANSGRAQFKHRLSVMASSKAELAEKLKTKEAVGLVKGMSGASGRAKAYPQRSRRVAFLFTGQGSQYVGMGQELYDTQPIFRQALDRCNEILRPYLDQPLLSILYPNPVLTKEGKEESSSHNPRTQRRQASSDAGRDAKSQTAKIDSTAYTQPALFALEYALAQLWKSWGIEPDVVIGHSVGEYVAACVAGVLSLEDGLKLIAERGRLMQALPQGGEMVAVLASEVQVKPLLFGKVSIAAVNGPRNVVISGEGWAVRRVVQALELKGIKTRALTVSHAFHSALMEPMLPDFLKVARTVNYCAPQIDLISNLTGQVAETPTADYWCRHIRQAVRFADGVSTIYEQGYDIFVEIGPKPTLLGMARRFAPSSLLWLPSLRPGRGDWEQMLDSLAQLYVRGGAVDWQGFTSRGQRVPLPTYPWQRESYWPSSSALPPTSPTELARQLAEGGQAQTPAWTSLFKLLHEGDSKKVSQQLATSAALSEEELNLLPKLLDLLSQQHQQQLVAASIEDWLYEYEWQPKPLGGDVTLTELSSEGGEPGSWLILAPSPLELGEKGSKGGGIGRAIADLLALQGHQAILVVPSEGFGPLGDDSWGLNPTADPSFVSTWFERLLQEMAGELPLKGVIHLWSLDAEEALEQGLLLSCGSTLHLLQSLSHYMSLNKLKQRQKPRLWLVTQGAQIEVESAWGAAQATLWGLGRVIALEHPDLWGGLIDLPPSPTSEPDLSRGTPEQGSKEGRGDEAEWLVQEVLHSDGEDQLAFRNGERLVARLVRVGALREPALLDTPIVIQADGSYLITGGLGALGLALARWLVAEGAGSLILTGRSGAKSEAQKQAIRELREAGAEVELIKADISKREDVVRLLAASPTPLRGIIHAAGVLDDGLLRQQTWPRFEKVMAAKVQGAWHLHTLTQEMPLDFLILFSSAASLTGSVGQANYAAANAFMDGLADYRTRLGLPALSINWGPWAEAGMAVRSQVNQSNMAGVTPLTSEQGVEVLAQLLGASGQVGALAVDWSQVAHITPLLSELVELKEKQSDQATFRQQLQEATNPSHFLMTHIQSEVRQVLGSIPDPKLGFFEMGMDSLMSVELSNRLSVNLGETLPPTLAFEYSTIQALSDYIGGEVLGWTGATSNPLENRKSKIVNLTSENEPIAIIGMSCRFPGGANDPQAFWELLHNGVDTVTEIPSSRWDVSAFYDPNPDTPGKMYTREGAFLDTVDHFDPLFFNISPREAISLDPQQRLLLEVSWEALENAAYAPEQLIGSRTGIFVGMGQNDYEKLLQLRAESPEHIGVYEGTGNGLCFASGRLSYTLGLQGPNMAVDTACSSSLVAVHLAVMSLRAGECEMALAGGVHLILSPEVYIGLSRMRALSPDGRCKTFSAQADGYGRGEGGAMIVLKRLSDAQADGDNILALIRGSAINHDGKSSGLTVPNKLAQEAVIRQALINGQVEANNVTYVEAHGTGTSLGDPIEVRALTSVLRSHTQSDFTGEVKELMIGSVKSNIGHLEAAAGIAGMIKVVLSLQHGVIPPHLHFHEPNPHLNWDELPVKIPTEAMPWSYPKGMLRNDALMAGISSFGLSGTNAHLVLSGAPVPDGARVRQAQSSGGQGGDKATRPIANEALLTLSAKTEEGLGELVERYIAYFAINPNLNVLDVCFTSNVGRSHFQHRLAVLATSLDEAREKLKAFQRYGQDIAGVWKGEVTQLSEDSLEMPPLPTSPTSPTSPLELGGIEGGRGIEGERGTEARELAPLYVEGTQINWSELWATARLQNEVRRLPLPTYPFQRQRYWTERQVTTHRPPPRLGGGLRGGALTRSHPILGAKIVLPAPNSHQVRTSGEKGAQTLYQLPFSAATLPLLSDHRIYNEVVVPGACHIALLLMAAPQGETNDTEAITLTDVLFPQALVLPDGTEPILQVIFSESEEHSSLPGFEGSEGREGAQHSFKLISFDDVTPSDFTTHAVGNISRVASDYQIMAPFDLAEVQERLFAASYPDGMISGSELYEALRRREVQLGGTFQWVESIWTEEREALCQMRPPQRLSRGTPDWEGNEEPWLLYPGLIDACFQFLVAFGESDEDETILPWRIEAFYFYRQPYLSREVGEGTLWCYARQISEPGDEIFIADIQLMQESGELIAEIIGFEARKAPREALLLRQEWLYEIAWQPKRPAPTPSPSPNTRGGEPTSACPSLPSPSIGGGAGGGGRFRGVRPFGFAQGMLFPGGLITRFSRILVCVAASDFLSGQRRLSGLGT